MTNNTESMAWALLSAVRTVADSGWLSDRRNDHDAAQSIGFYYDVSTGKVDSRLTTLADAQLFLDNACQWHYSNTLPKPVIDQLDLYLPVLGTPAQESVVIGHLGQSLDSRVATGTGDALYVTGIENRKHLHRMRALCHAVVVGAGTIITDDPQLTTRDVNGANAIRVVIDPNSRVPDVARILTDGVAPTWLLHHEENLRQDKSGGIHVQRIGLNNSHGRMECANIIDELRLRGVSRVFIEGGGVTVSGFLKANTLHCLQLAVAPLLIGDGRAAIDLPDAVSMQAAHRAPHKIYRMGGDILWDFDLRKADSSSPDVNQADADLAGPDALGIERLL